MILFLYIVAKINILYYRYCRIRIYRKNSSTSLLNVVLDEITINYFINLSIDYYSDRSSIHLLIKYLKNIQKLKISFIHFAEFYINSEYIIRSIYEETKLIAAPAPYGPRALLLLNLVLEIIEILEFSKYIPPPELILTTF